jgi:hypothetical protein
VTDYVYYYSDGPESVEEPFRWLRQLAQAYEQRRLIGPGWRIVREPAPLPAEHNRSAAGLWRIVAADGRRYSVLSS